MELKIKSIDMPQIWEDGSTASVDLYMLQDKQLIGTMFVAFDFREGIDGLTVSEISNLAIAKAKKLLA